MNVWHNHMGNGHFHAVDIFPGHSPSDNIATPRTFPHALLQDVGHSSWSMSSARQRMTIDSL